jgi:hypothetical protein
MALLLDVVELQVETGRWAQGTRGTVIEVVEDGVLVEIADEHGHTQEVVALPHGAVRAVASPDQGKLLV